MLEIIWQKVLKLIGGGGGAIQSLGEFLGLDRLSTESLKSSKNKISCIYNGVYE